MKRVRLSLDTDSETKARLEAFCGGSITEAVKRLAKLGEALRREEEAGKTILLRDKQGNDTRLLFL